MIEYALYIVLVVMFLILMAMVVNEEKYIKLLLCNSFSSCAVVAVLLMASSHQAWEYLDIAMIYVLVSFVGIVALMRFAIDRSFYDSDWR